MIQSNEACLTVFLDLRGVRRHNQWVAQGDLRGVSQIA
jgi:hypothetical protein